MAERFCGCDQQLGMRAAGGSRSLLVGIENIKSVATEREQDDNRLK